MMQYVLKHLRSHHKFRSEAVEVEMPSIQMFPLKSLQFTPSCCPKIHKSNTPKNESNQTTFHEVESFLKFYFIFCNFTSSK